jgi:LysR family hydrogen peroxide-inducible transcriptional activator
LLAALKAGALDAALIALPYETTGLETARVGDDELLAAFPADHPLTATQRVTLAGLRDQELILLEDGHCLRDQALSACGLEPQRGDAFAATSLHTLVQMVGSGLGVSFLPAMAVDAGLAERALVTVRPLESDGISREIAIAWRGGSSRGIEARLLAETLATV